MTNTAASPMRALVLRARAPATPIAVALELDHVAVPTPRDDELLVKVAVCGICRTDLDMVEGRVIAPRYPVIPGHQIVGRVAAAGRATREFRAGDRVGIAWIHSACGECRWCRGGEENLCPYFESTGCDAHGGYAEYVTVREAFAHAIPDSLSDEHAAPLLCAGAIGWRSLLLARLRRGDPLGLSGFGASGHLVLQLAHHLHPDSPVYVFARNAGERDFAMRLGATWAGDTADAPPAPLGAIIDTTPAWKPVVWGARHLMPGGRLVINAIRKSSADQQELLSLDYATDLWMEREIKSVANVTRADVRDMLSTAAAAGIRPTIEEFSLERVPAALERLRGGSLQGAMVARV